MSFVYKILPNNTWGLYKPRLIGDVEHGHLFKVNFLFRKSINNKSLSHPI